MAIYHLSVKPIQRSKGHSSVASAAYRAGAKLQDKRTGITYDYHSKCDVIHREIIGWSGTREALWNAAEQAEVRKDATTAREYEVALPKELSWEDNEKLAISYANWLHDEYGVAVDVCIHNAKITVGQNGTLECNNNMHAHILTTTRRVSGVQLTSKTEREWSDTRRKKAGLLGRKNELVRARESWAQLANTALSNLGSKEKIDHRSNATRGVEVPAQIHVGSGAMAISKNNHSDRHNENEVIKKAQVEIRNNLIEIGKTEQEIQRLKEHVQKGKMQSSPLATDENGGGRQSKIEIVETILRKLRGELNSRKPEDFIFPKKPRRVTLKSLVNAKKSSVKTGIQLTCIEEKIRHYKQNNWLKSFFQYLPLELIKERELALKKDRDSQLELKKQQKRARDPKVKEKIDAENRRNTLVYTQRYSEVERNIGRAKKMDEEIRKAEAILLGLERERSNLNANFDTPYPECTAQDEARFFEI